MTKVNLGTFDKTDEDSGYCEVSHDVFVHGDELWRLQETTSWSGGIVTHTMDYTREEFEILFPGAYAKVSRGLEEV